jgi:hypothetical protein
MSQTEFDNIVTDIFAAKDQYCSAMSITEFLEIHPAKGWWDTKYRFVVDAIVNSVETV